MNEQFGLWTVISSYWTENHIRYVMCRCACGREKRVSLYTLQHGSSSGCARCKAGRPQNGRSLYRAENNAWRAMKRRCENPKNKRYKDYGGRGIKVCERWDSFENFLADMGRRPKTDFSLERKDNNGNYSPENCVWVAMAEQNRNKRNTIRTSDGTAITAIFPYGSLDYFRVKNFSTRMTVDNAVEEARRLQDLPSRASGYGCGWARSWPKS